MKRKLTAFLAACVMLLSLVPAVTAADVVGTGELEDWMVTRAEWVPEGGVPNESTITLEEDEVDGVTKPVMKWVYYKTDTLLKYKLGKLPVGTYKISTYIKSEQNMGEGHLGITTDDAIVSFPQFDGNYRRVEREVVVTEENKDTEQELVFAAKYGDDAGVAYISEVSMKRKNDDGTYGPEMIVRSDFRPYDIPEGSDSFWSIEGAYGYQIEKDTVNGEIKNVLRVNYRNGDGTTIYADVKNGSLEAGKYRISITTRSPNNSGESWWGITLTDEGGFPDNSKAYDKWPVFSDAYTVSTRDVVVTSPSTKQQLNFKTGWGDDNCPLYIADVKLQRVYEDGTLGENRIINPDFTADELPSNEYPVREILNWSKYHGSPDFTEKDSFTVRTVTGKDGEQTRALVGYKAANNPGIKAIMQDVPTEAGKTYRVTYDYKQIGAVQNFGTRINEALQGDFYATYVPAAAAGATDWATKTCEYVMGASDVPDNFLAFSLEGQSFEGEQLVYIDNVKFQEVIDENTLGPNLITNGDFEAKSYQTDLMFDIYDDTDTSVTGGEGFGNIPDFSLDDLGYKMVAKATITNGENETVTPVFIVAVYDAGALCGMEIVTASIAGGATEEWIGTVELPDSVGSGNVAAKAFVWEDLNGLKPISDVAEISE